MRFRISQKALKDIEVIWLFTLENWSLSQADRYYDAIFDEIEYLSNNPLSGRDYDHVKKGYRCSKVKSHLIFYRITDNNKILEVIRVLHSRMDIERRLND